ncbi:hypothetical protein K501DRAFT_175754, partial [Backusella circina FSU 941]
GRKNVFTATIGHDCSEHEVRQCRNKEKICYTGSQRRVKHVDKLKERIGIKKFETNIPSPKTDASEELIKYVEYALTLIDSLFGFYSEKSVPFRFYDYQGRQRCNDEIVNIFIDGEKKYNKARRKKTKKQKARNDEKASAIRDKKKLA